MPVRVILLIVGLEPLDQLGVDGEGVLAVGESVPHLNLKKIKEMRGNYLQLTTSFLGRLPILSDPPAAWLDRIAL